MTNPFTRTRTELLYRLVAMTMAAWLLLPPLAAANGSARIGLKDLPNRYRQILDLYSNGEQDRAVAELLELETALVVDPGGTTIKALWRAKLQVIRDLLGAGNEILIPIALLHEQAYLEYLERNESALATHSRIMSVELIEVYATDSEENPDLVLASNALTSLAGHLQQYYRDSDAAALYYQAIRFNPSNVTAYLGVAAIHERHGEYNLAIRHFERLIEVDPKCHEGRLRLGVNLARAGRLDESADTLRPLLHADAPDWVASVAYEEAARVEVERGDLRSAYDLLLQAVERFPQDTTLPIQLAYVADRAGSTPDDPDLAAALKRGTDPGTSSPRYVYSQAPIDDLKALRLELVGETSNHLSALSRALNFPRTVEAGP